MFCSTSPSLCSMAKLPLSSLEWSKGVSSGYPQAPPVEEQNPQIGRWLSHFVFRPRQTKQAVPARLRAYEADSREMGPGPELNWAGPGSGMAGDSAAGLLEAGWAGLCRCIMRTAGMGSERMLASKGAIAGPRRVSSISVGNYEALRVAACSPVTGYSLGILATLSCRHGIALPGLCR